MAGNKDNFEECWITEERNIAAKRDYYEDRLMAGSFDYYEEFETSGERYCT